MLIVEKNDLPYNVKLELDSRRTEWYIYIYIHIVYSPSADLTIFMSVSVYSRSQVLEGMILVNAWWPV